MIIDAFDVAPGTAKVWLGILQGKPSSKKKPKAGKEPVAFVIEQPGDRRQEKHLVPSASTKTGLFRVGMEYLACLRLVSEQLSDAMEYSKVSIDDLDWLRDIKSILKLDIVDYATKESCDTDMKSPQA